MNIQPNLGHSTNQIPIGQISDVSAGELDLIQDTSEKILGVLDKQDANYLKRVNIKFNKYLHKISLEVNRIEALIGYNYYVTDYIRRVSQDNDTMLSGLVQLYKKYPKLHKILLDFQKDFGHYGNYPLLENYIIENYLLNLAYIIIDRSELEVTEETTPAREHIFTLNKNMIEIIVDNPDELIQYVNKYNNSNILVLMIDGTDFSLLSDDQLELIFTTFKNIRVISAKNGGIDRLNIGQAKIVSKYLSNVKGFDVGLSFFYGMNARALGILCSSLINLSYFNFDNNSLYHTSIEKISAIFNNLKGLKYLSCYGIEFGSASEAKIDLMFSNSASLEYIDLTFCKLNNMDDTMLTKFLKYFVNCKSVYIYSNQFDDEQKELVKSLLPNSNVVV